MSGTTVTGLLKCRALFELHPDFTMTVDAAGFRASHDYPSLDEAFLEAERVQITDTAKAAKLSLLSSRLGRMRSSPPRK